MLTVKILTIMTCIAACTADIQDLITRDIVDMDADQCLKDNNIAKICLKCSSLPFYAIPSVDTCCSDKSAFLLCEACVDDQDSCQMLMKEIEELESLSEERDENSDYYDDIDDTEDSGEDVETPVTSSVEKRFGKLFVKGNPKRFGKIFFGKRSEQNVDDYSNEMEKRFGRIFMGRGSYFGKRSEIDKRYGRLFTTSNRYFGKRSPYSIDNDLEYDNYDDNDLGISKRYGRIYMGNRRNKMFGKRYGRIFFGKRSVDNKGKRFGTLHMGTNKYFMRNPNYINMDKRYGRLFTGRGKYYFGKSI